MDEVSNSSYSLVELFTQGLPLYNNHNEDKDGSILVKVLEELEDVTGVELGKNYKEWRRNFSLLEVRTNMLFHRPILNPLPL